MAQLFTSMPKDPVSGEIALVYNPRIGANLADEIEWRAYIDGCVKKRIVPFATTRITYPRGSKTPTITLDTRKLRSSYREDEIKEITRLGRCDHIVIRFGGEIDHSESYKAIKEGILEKVKKVYSLSGLKVGFLLLEPAMAEADIGLKARLNDKQNLPSYSMTLSLAERIHKQPEYARIAMDFHQWFTTI